MLPKSPLGNMLNFQVTVEKMDKWENNKLVENTYTDTAWLNVNNKFTAATEDTFNAM